MIENCQAEDSGTYRCQVRALAIDVDEDVIVVDGDDDVIVVDGDDHPPHFRVEAYVLWLLA